MYENEYSSWSWCRLIIIHTVWASANEYLVFGDGLFLLNEQLFFGLDVRPIVHSVSGHSLSNCTKGLEPSKHQRRLESKCSPHSRFCSSFETWPDHPLGKQWTFVCLAPRSLSLLDPTSLSFIINSCSPVSELLKTRQFSLENQSWHTEKLMNRLLLNAKPHSCFFNVK